MAVRPPRLPEPTLPRRPKTVRGLPPGRTHSCSVSRNGLLRFAGQRRPATPPSPDPRSSKVQVAVSEVGVAVNRFGLARFPGISWYHIPMKAVVDSVGRVVVPKPLRDALGLQPGSQVEISRYGAGLQLVPAGRTAEVVVEGGVSVITGNTRIDDETVFDLLDAGRR